MHSSDLITPQHLARKAVIYIRQSTPHQVVSHQESLRLQYALRERARQLGWPDEAIDIIDDDLGLTAASAAHREGFNTLVAQVTLEQVGLILSYDVTRLSRNCSDWYPLLDLCGYKGCLIADGDGIYDPATVNGRLLLGLKGTLSEWERHTMKARLTAGLLHKAAARRVGPDPAHGPRPQRAGHRCTRFPTRKPKPAWRWCSRRFYSVARPAKSSTCSMRHDLLLPRRDRFGDLVWKAPRVAAVLAILKHPAYAGAFTYGRTRTLRREATPGAPRDHPSAPGAVAHLHPGRLPALHQLGDLSRRFRPCSTTITPSMTATKPAASHALAKPSCTASSTAGNAATRWWCSIRGAPATSVTTCGNSIGPPCVNILRPIRSIPGSSTRFSRPSRPWNSMSMRRRWPSGSSRPSASPTPTRSIWSGCAMRRPIVNANSTTSIRRIAMSPPNWNTRGRWPCKPSSRPKPPSSSAPRPARRPPTRCRPRCKRPSAPLASTLPELWPTDVLSQAQRKALLRCLIDKVVIQRARRDQIHTRIVWRGGETTTFEVPVAVGALTDLPGAHEMAQQIRVLFAEGTSDDEMARQLTQHGYRSPSRPAVLPSTVKGIRLKLGLMQNRSQSHPRRIAGYLTVPQLAKALGITPHWVYHQIKRGTVVIQRDAQTRLYLFPDRPETLEAFGQLRAGQRSDAALLSSASPPSQTQRGSGKLPEGASAPRRSDACGGKSWINTAQ